MSSDNILVAIKSRPFIFREKSQKLTPQWSIQQTSIFQIDETLHRPEPYYFDHIFTEENTNSDVYNSVVKPLIQSCLEGFNSTVFAYGQTSSGKTHTMMGNGNTPGIVQMAVNDIFDHIQKDKRRRYLIGCSYFEIYNEKINDLLNKNEKDLKIREDCDGNTFITATEEVVTIPDQVYELMALGNKIRKIGCTNMNERSSRSHTIFRFTIESTDNNVENGSVQISQLNLVDLAGSERVAQMKAEGRRLQEGVHINKSLSVLGKVIRQLSDSERYISYRDSKLTRLLQQALGGNAKSLIIATITLAAGEETKSTLEFAQRAKAIKNKPVINEIMSEPDKLKKYEAITAGYQERLAVEQQRAAEMEARFQQERDEREKEISKLKEQCKLIDLFTKGPQARKPETRVHRRHTIGHNAGMPMLETIPELSVAPSTCYRWPEDGQSQDSESASSPTSRDSELHQPELEETLATALTLSPEAGQNGFASETAGETPPAFLRKRIKSLEESYTSLREFTKLEAECKDKDKYIVQDLVAEKAKLSKDWEDLNVMFQAERLEKENIKMEFKDKEVAWKEHLADLSCENMDLSVRLDSLEAENDLLKMYRNRELTDHQVLVEQRTKNYEKQIEYLKAEIKRLNDEMPAKTEEMSDVETLQHKIKALEQENCRLTVENMEKQTKIENLEEEMVKKDECFCDVTSDILSKLYMLQDDILISANTDVQGTTSQIEHVDFNDDKKELAKVQEELIQTKMEYENTKQKMDMMRSQTESLRIMKDKVISMLEERLKFLEIEYQNCKSRKVQVKLQDELTDALNLIEELNEKIEIQAQHNIFLTEEKDVCLKHVELLTELLSACDEDRINYYIQEEQELLDSFQNQLKSYSEEIFMDCNEEMDQFVAYLFELKNITTEVFLQEEIELILVSIEHSAENFIKLLEEFAKNLSNDDHPEYFESTEKINSLCALVREKKNYITYTEQNNNRLQLKIDKQIKYLEQLNEVKQRICNEKSNDQKIMDLNSRMEDLRLQTTSECEAYEKRIVELESTVAKLKLERADLKANLAKAEEHDANSDLQKIIALTEENMVLRTELVGLRSDRDELADEVARLQKAVAELQSNIEMKQSKNLDLGEKLEEMYQENVTLTIKTFDLEGQIEDLKSPRDIKVGSISTGTSTDDIIIDSTGENLNLRAEVEELRSERDKLISELATLKESLGQIQSNSVAEIQLEKLKNQELCKKLDNLKASRSSESLESQRSSSELSPREARRRKRQSLQDQRRGIDPDDLQDKIDQLMVQIKDLTTENEFLEFEVQGFISELDDYKRYNNEKYDEIELLKKQIEEAKLEAEKAKGDCKECEAAKEYNKKLEELHRARMFEVVDLQTKIFDMHSAAEVERNNRDEVERVLRYKYSKLKEKLGTREVQDSAVQCDISDHATLMVKYTNLKKLARLRREEGNILRARLGMEPDTPLE